MNRDELARSFDAGLLENFDYMLVVRETHTHEEFVVYCSTATARAKYAQYANTLRVHAIYDLHGNKNAQLAEFRPWYFPPKEPDAPV